MKNPRIEGLVRLGFGTVLNVLLWELVGRNIGKSGGLDDDFQKAMIAMLLGAPALVCVIPVFWRGEAWHAPLAFVLMPLPGLLLFFVVHLALHWL